jgi:hypothetical protein
MVALPLLEENRRVLCASSAYLARYGCRIYTASRPSNIFWNAGE